jgi:hypothetical protein
MGVVVWKCHVGVILIYARILARPSCELSCDWSVQTGQALLLLVEEF